MRQFNNEIINNEIYIGKIIEHKATDNSNLYKIEIDECGETDFIPSLVQLSGLNKTHIPYNIGDSVVAISRNDDINDGIIFGAINTKNNKSISNNLDEFITSYKDGTEIKYNTNTSTLDINCQKQININAKSVNLLASSVEVVADNVTVDSPNINLGTGGTGIITCESMCPFTGSPHMDGSTNTTSVK